MNLPPAQRRLIDQTANNVHTIPACVPDMVTWQAGHSPHRIAISTPFDEITYRTLNSRATELAWRLSSTGLRSCDIAGICLPRTVELPVACLAVWKAGAAFVPMDPDDPAGRLRFMLNDSQARVVVTTSQFASRFDGMPVQIVDLSERVPVLPSAVPLPAISARQLCYVVYTSGHTGQPHGVEITHAALTNLIHWHRRAFTVGPDDRASQITPPGFDESIWEVWPYLASGASVHVADDQLRHSPDQLRDWLIEERITVSYVPADIAERLMAYPWPAQTALKVLLTCGDSLVHYPRPHLPFIVVNNYGPAECCIVTASGLISPVQHSSAVPPVGRAIAGMEIFLLDKAGCQVPAGDSGEICVAGVGVARGYRNQPELTARSFVQLAPDARGPLRMFRSGDFGRILPDGQLALLPRVDDQIRMRGYRIEPAEIVRNLNLHPFVENSAVIAREDTPGASRLVAYVMLASGKRLGASELRTFLADRIPGWMMPAAFVTVKDFSFTLPVPHASNTLSDRPRPRALT